MAPITSGDPWWPLVHVEQQLLGMRKKIDQEEVLTWNSWVLWPIKLIKGNSSVENPFLLFFSSGFFFWCRLETPYNHCINEGPTVDRLNLLAFWRQNEQDVCCPHAQQTTAHLVASAGGFGYRVVFLPGKNSTVIFRPRVQVNLFVYLKQNTFKPHNNIYLNLNKNSM